jgi:dihydroorotase
MHVHLREPGQGYKETIATGTAAAAAGGFTAVAAMPNTTPVNDSPEITRWMQAPERGAVIRVFPHRRRHARIQGRSHQRLCRAQSAGAVAVTDDGLPILKDSVMREDAGRRGARGPERHPARRRHALTQGASMNAGPVLVQARPARHAA